MKKKVIVGVIIAVVVVIILGLFSPKGSNEPVKIGIALPLTGPAAFLGESAQNAAKLAIKDAGNTKYKYELVFEDDGFNPVKTVTAVNKFISIDKVVAMITFGSGTSNAAAPINEEAKIARFGLASDPTSAKGEYNFIHWTPAYKEGELLAQEIVKRGYKTVAIVNANHPGTNAVADAVKKSLEKTSVKLVAYENSNVGEKDFRTTVSKLKSLNPEIVVMTLFSPEIELFTKQSKELGSKYVITSAEAFEWSSEPALFEGLWFVGDSAVPQAFIDKFTSEYSSAPKPGSTYVYDLVSMIIKMQEDSNKKLSSTDIVKILNDKGYSQSDLFGKVVIDKDGLFITNASLKKIENGQGVFIK
jgi:branched-chain amino acid transport system substrate-binding protein